MVILTTPSSFSVTSPDTVSKFFNLVTTLESRMVARNGFKPNNLTPEILTKRVSLLA